MKVILKFAHDVLTTCCTYLVVMQITFIDNKNLPTRLAFAMGGANVKEPLSSSSALLKSDPQLYTEMSICIGI